MDGYRSLPSNSISINSVFAVKFCANDGSFGLVLARYVSLLGCELILGQNANSLLHRNVASSNPTGGWWIFSTESGLSTVGMAIRYLNLISYAISDGQFNLVVEGCMNGRAGS